MLPAGKDIIAAFVRPPDSTSVPHLDSICRRLRQLETGDWQPIWREESVYTTRRHAKNT